MVRVAILGYGGRGRIYAMILRFLQKRKAKLVAVIDNNPDKLALAKRDTKTLDDGCLYSDYAEFLKKDKCADWLFVCTQDSYHSRTLWRHSKKGMTCFSKSLFPQTLPNAPKSHESRRSWAEKWLSATCSDIPNSTIRSKKS